MKFARIQGDSSLHILEKKLPTLYGWIVKEFKEANDYMECEIEEGLYNEININLYLKGLNEKNNYSYEVNVIVEESKAVEFILYIHKDGNKLKVYDMSYSQFNWFKVMQYINELEKIGLTKREETMMKEISFIV